MNFLQNMKDIIITEINKALDKAQKDGSLPSVEPFNFNVEIPKEESFGDFSSNAAMMGAKVYRKAPPIIAKIIAEHIEPNKYIDSVTAAGGFVNFAVSKFYCSEVVEYICKNGSEYGKSDIGNGKKVMVEYVSANPTGMMHMGNARGGALGDCLATVLCFMGYDVIREFYINDAGNQIDKFKESLNARYLQLYKGEDFILFPEDGYHGEDIKERVKEFADINGDKYVECNYDERAQALVDYALPKNLNIIKKDLKRYKADFDIWFYESQLHESGAVDKIIKQLTDKGYTFTKDGALWYKATEFGAEKDEVLIRNNGNPTYFAADIAYHINKFVDRGFDKVIDIWGADHHGHVARLKGALSALDLDSDKLDIIIMQLVNLIQNGEAVKMSKRTGKSIMLSDLLDITNIDAARFFFNLRKADTHFDFDLDLSIAKTNQNPVYYVQYAHARICSIIAMLESSNISTEYKDCDLTLFKEKSEVSLIKQLSAFTDELIHATVDYDISRITKYTIDLATTFHSFYNECRVKCDDENLMYARIALIKAVKTVLKTALGILKVEAPEKM